MVVVASEWRLRQSENLSDMTYVIYLFIIGSRAKTTKSAEKRRRPNAAPCDLASSEKSRVEQISCTSSDLFRPILSPLFA